MENNGILAGSAAEPWPAISGRESAGFFDTVLLRIQMNVNLQKGITRLLDRDFQHIGGIERCTEVRRRWERSFFEN